MTVLATVTVSNAAVIVAWTVRSVRFSTGTVISTSALLLSALGRVVTTCASPSLAAPVALSTTSCHRPELRSRTLGIQSQPSVAKNVGPSSACMPPFSPAPALSDCSCGMPGWGGGDMRTARAFGAPGVGLRLASNRPRMKAPLISPIRAPFSHTSAA